MAQRALGAPATPETWRVELGLPEAALGPFEDKLASFGFAISTYIAAGAPLWRLQLLCAEAPDRAMLLRAIADAAGFAGIEPPRPEIAALPSIDWVAHANKLLRPVRAGRFFLYGRHDAGQVPPGAWPLLIEAGRAFGTGRAPSTLGCLLAIAAIVKRAANRPRRALDIGTGSGVLALAIARAANARVVACDIDPVAVEVARANAKLNRLDDRVRTVRASRLDHSLIRARAPFDLIVANILVRPLKRLAPAIARRIVRGGAVILSGLLASEERDVLASYRNLGFRLDRRIAREGWNSLVLRSGGYGA